MKRRFDRLAAGLIAACAAWVLLAPAQEVALLPREAKHALSLHYEIERVTAQLTAEAEREAEGKPLAPQQTNSIATLAWLAFRAITEHGLTTEENWSVLAQAANVSLLLTEMDIGAEHAAIVKDGQSALMRACARGKTSGRWGFDGHGIQAIEMLLTLHDAQIEIATRSEIKTALRTLRERISAGNILKVETA
jgi:hypothetical protein